MRPTLLLLAVRGQPRKYGKFLAIARLPEGQRISGYSDEKWNLLRLKTQEYCRKFAITFRKKADPKLEKWAVESVSACVENARLGKVDEEVGFWMLQKVSRDLRYEKIRSDAYEEWKLRFESQKLAVAAWLQLQGHIKKVVDEFITTHLDYPVSELKLRSMPDEHMQWILNRTEALNRQAKLPDIGRSHLGYLIKLRFRSEKRSDRLRMKRAGQGVSLKAKQWRKTVPSDISITLDTQKKTREK